MLVLKISHKNFSSQKIKLPKISPKNPKKEAFSFLTAFFILRNKRWEQKLICASKKSGRPVSKAELRKKGKK